MISTYSRMHLAGIFLAFTASTAAVAQDQPPAKENKPQCTATIAKVLVSKVSCTAALCTTTSEEGGFVGLLSKLAAKGTIDAAQFSSATGSQLSTALKQTGCFDVVDAVGMEEIRKEMEALGRPAPPPPAFDYIVKANITKAEVQKEQTGVLMFKKTVETTSLALDVKLIHADNGTVVDAAMYEGIQQTGSGVSVGNYYSSGDKQGKLTTPFSGVANEAATKAAAGLAMKVLAQGGATKASAQN